MTSSGPISWARFEAAPLQSRAPARLTAQVSGESWAGQMAPLHSSLAFHFAVADEPLYYRNRHTFYDVALANGICKFIKYFNL